MLAGTEEAIPRVTRAAHALLESLIDYAGMFPPAALPLSEAVANYERYREGEYAWILGKFVAPAAAVCHPERSEGSSGDDLARDPSPSSRLRMTEMTVIGVDEVKATSEAEIERIDRPGTWVEIRDVRLLDAIAKRNLRAKIRCGGDRVPSVGEVAAFITGCHERRLPFKATAGLHHPLRSGNAHGFVNVFLAAALPHVAEKVLADDDPRSFKFTDEAAWWRGREVTVAEIEEMRQLAVSFGSCSFDEPVAGMKELGWL